MNDLPKLTPENSIKIQVLCDLFFRQFWTFAEFLNEAPERIPTIKYAEFVAYMLTEEVKELKSKRQQGGTFLGTTDTKSTRLDRKRSKREDPEKGCGTLNIAEMQ